MKTKAVVSWSSGKDSAWTLHVLREQDEFEIVGLVSTVNQEFRRVAMHGTRVEVLHAQARVTGLALREVELPWPCSNEIYEERMRVVVSQLVAEGVEVMAFGDLFLEDIRAYREKNLAGSGLRPLFPLWKIPTDELLEQMIGGGLRARIATLDPRVMPRELIGREIDRELVAALPPGVDPCAENGEFHTIAFAGPMFSEAVALLAGEIVEREGFLYQDFFTKAPLRPRNL